MDEAKTALTGREQTPTEISDGQGSGSQVPAIVPRGKGFQPGHPRYGGRKRGAPIKRTKEAREIADKLGFHVMEFLITVAQRGVMPNPDGTETPVDAEMRMDAAKAAAPYLLPKLAQTAVTGVDGGPLAVAALDVTALMADPVKAKAAQELAMLLAEQEILAIDAAPEDKDD